MGDIKIRTTGVNVCNNIIICGGYGITITIFSKDVNVANNTINMYGYNKNNVNLVFNGIDISSRSLSS